jgi:hypothetical protein
MSPAIRRVNIAESTLRAAPLRPEQIVSGDPVARIVLMDRCADRLNWIDQWDCTAGEFTWDYPDDEMVYVLEGEAIITDADGVVWTLRPGDVVTFRKGTSAHWKVPKYVRKLAFGRRRTPTWLAYLIYVQGAGLAVLGRAWRRLTSGSPAVATKRSSE